MTEAWCSWARRPRRSTCREPRQARGHARLADTRQALPHRGRGRPGQAQSRPAASTRRWPPTRCLARSPAFRQPSARSRAGGQYYRGRDAVRMASTATLEDAAQLLWGAEHAVDFTCMAPCSGKPGRGAAFAALAGHRRRPFHQGPPDPGAACRKPDLVGRLANAFGASLGHELLHLRRRKDGSSLPRWPICCERPWCCWPTTN